MEAASCRFYPSQAADAASTITRDKIREVGGLERVFFEREMLVRAQVVNPEFFRPRAFVVRGFFVEEEHVGLHALGVKDSGGETKERVDIRLLEELAADGFARAAFKEDVVGQHHGGASVLFEDGENVLEKVELFVAGARPKIVAVDDERFLGGFAFLVDDGDAAFFAKGGLARTMSYSPCLPLRASRVVTGRVLSESPPMPWSMRFIAQRRVTLSTSSTPCRVPFLRKRFCSLSSLRSGRAR